MHFLIVGGGIAGLTTALALLQQGHTIQVLESAAELREIGAGVVLGANAMQALAHLGVHAPVRAAGYPITRIRLLDEHGRLLNEVDTTPFTQRLGYDNLAIHRADLQRVLLQQLPADLVQLGKSLERFEQHGEQVTAYFADGTSASGHALIGADGIHSRVRRQLLPDSQPRYAGYTCWRGVLDATSLALPAGQSIEVWGRAGRFGAVPLPNGHVYWFACINTPMPNDPHYRAYRLADVQRHFAGYHFPVPELLARTHNAHVLWGDIIDLAPLRHFAYGRVLLLGDAAHATTPNLGQGAGQAVEDAAVLAECLTKHAVLEDAFRQFELRRRPRTTRIVRQSRQLGWAAQLQQPAVVAVRNAVMRLLPASVNTAQMRFLYEQ